MKEYNIDIPIEPGFGSVLVGKSGRAYQSLEYKENHHRPHIKALYYSLANITIGHGTYTWPELLINDAPLKLIYDPTIIEKPMIKEPLPDKYYSKEFYNQGGDEGNGDRS